MSFQQRNNRRRINKINQGHGHGKQNNRYGHPENIGVNPFIAGRFRRGAVFPGCFRNTLPDILLAESHHIPDKDSNGAYTAHHSTEGSASYRPNMTPADLQQKKCQTDAGNQPGNLFDNLGHAVRHHHLTALEIPPHHGDQREQQQRRRQCPDGHHRIRILRNLHRIPRSQNDQKRSHNHTGHQGKSHCRLIDAVRLGVLAQLHFFRYQLAERAGNACCGNGQKRRINIKGNPEGCHPRISDQINQGNPLDNPKNPGHQGSQSENQGTFYK
ncbi:hypothetical protein D3C75_854130 [compost metagenome]